MSSLSNLWYDKRRCKSSALLYVYFMPKLTPIIFLLILFSLIFPFQPLSAQIAGWEGPTDPLFNPNHIVSDREMVDYNSLTLKEIQAFLDNKPGALKKYEVVDPTTGLNKTAAEIIFQAAQNYQINPKILLVFLQKEQSLVENPNPPTSAFDWATGYGVCDSCSFDDPNVLKHKGFAKQVDDAASFLRYCFDNANLSWIKKYGLIYNIDSIPVIPANYATAFLYTYTPHFRGNYNFWRVWNRWFSQKFPDGMIVQIKNDDKIYLIKDGKILPFKNKAIFLSRYNPKNITLINQTDLDSYKKGPEIKFLNYSLVKTEKKEIYLLVDGKKRLLEKAAFRYYGFDPDEVIPGQEADLAVYDEGEPVSVKAKYPLGAIMQDGKTKEYFLVVDSVKYPLYDKILLAINFPSKKARKVTSLQLKKYQTGDPVLFNDGTWIKTKDSPEIFIVSNGARRLIKDETTFVALGGQDEKVIITNEKSMAAHPLGEPISLTPNPSSLTAADK